MTLSELAGLLLIAGWLVTAFRFRIMASVCPEPIEPDNPFRNDPIKVSIIIPARNEEAKIANALKTWQSVNWPDLEFILVNDRSTDATCTILADIAEKDSRIRVLTISELSAGWLGKNYALHTGAQSATGEWLVFTDADIHIHPDLIRNSIYLAAQRGIDFAAGLPRFASENFWNTSFVLAFGTALSLSQQFDRVHLPHTKAFCGIGAFNLIRRNLYVKMDGHSGQKLDVADDMVLGRRAKEAGGRCIILNCHRQLAVEWQEDTLQGAIRGIEKNAFTGFSYSVLKMVTGLSLFLFFTSGPLFLLFLSPWWGFFGLTTQLLAFSWYAPVFQSRSGWWGLMLPVASVLLSWAIVRSAALAITRGGIRWRDTVYPLDEIRKNNHF